MYNKALCRIEDHVLSMCGKNLSLVGLKDVAPVRNSVGNLSREMIRETSYSRNELSEFLRANEPNLNVEQKTVYHEIEQSINNGEGKLFFLDAPGGTGKTFLINLILAKLRMSRKIAIAVATSGIAATLLPGGRTAHSMFKLPLNLNSTDEPVCNISKGTGAATLLKEAKLIVWDECTMAHRKMLEALDRTLRDIRGANCLMGGLTILLSGDFRQTLPVIPKGTPADELHACLKASTLWQHINRLQLSINMRVQLQSDSGRFSEEILRMGNGAIASDSNGEITVPDDCGTVFSEYNDLLTAVYPNLADHFSKPGWIQWLAERAILAPKNDMVDEINHKVLGILPGAEYSSKSIDTVMDPGQVVHYPQEFLHSIQPAGLPPHNLRLKVGAPIMLLRNLDAPRLCNGTRLVVKNVMKHVLGVTIMTGCVQGEDTFIPRIPIIPTDLPFEFKRSNFQSDCLLLCQLTSLRARHLK